ncbi:MAG TPA: CDP-alcohol phosphatidyltransferase family protein [Dongiaceae bacterium]|nr:CDP-alcohol phosphatidyltransferase family protein [Dongiaceae bacterium]
MIVWIDAARSAGERVFGLGMIERHLKALRHRRVAVSAVIVDLGDSGAADPAIVQAKWPFPVRVARGAGTIRERVTAAAVGAPALVVDADTLADARLYDFLATQSGDLVASDGDAILARLEDPSRLQPGATRLSDAIPADALRLTQAAFPGFIRNLRRTLPFYLFRVTDDAQRKSVERFLFWSNYKGSTDFFTKYVYPPLVWILVRPLARWGVHPNTVTAISIVLTLAVIPLCAAGHFLAGFLCAYGMSVLDSVDGKLARLTFTDSKIGNILDHGLDLVHPPFWYCAWAYGLTLGTGAVTGSIAGSGGGGDVSSPVFIASLWMLGLYVLDRLILKVYPTRFGRGLHTHAPMDGFVRTFISRRNINLPLFTVGYYAGLGIETIYLMVVWQALTCLYHGARTAWILAYDRPGTAPSH